jgi:hypothetical protein
MAFTAHAVEHNKSLGGNINEKDSRNGSGSGNGSEPGSLRR